MQLSGKVKVGLATTAVAGVLAAGAVIPAVAQDDTSTERSQGGSTEDRVPGARAGAFAAALAEELGIEQERVEEALANIREERRAEVRERRLSALEERLAEAVENGDLTQEQADAILEAAEDGVLPLGPRRHGPRSHHLDGPGPHLTPGPHTAPDSDTDSEDAR